MRWLQKTLNLGAAATVAALDCALLQNPFRGAERVKRLQKAIGCLQHQGLQADFPHYAWLVQECGKLGALPEGQLVHASLRENGLDRHRLMANYLINMYGKCGSVDDAREVFDTMSERDISSWNAMIGAYAQHGQGDMAFRLYQRMKIQGWKPNKITLVTLLTSCTGPQTLEQGRLVHGDILDCGFESDVIVGTALVKMYANCCKLENAMEVFEKLPEKNVISWTVMITALVQHGHFEEALQVFRRMMLHGSMPNKFTFVSILGACASPEALEQGRLIHAQISKDGFAGDVVVGNALLNMYGKCCSLDDAYQVFEQMPERDVASWTAIIATYAKHGHTETSLKLFSEMQYQGVKPNQITVVSAISGFSRPEYLLHGKMLHAHLIEDALESDVIVMNALISMYAKCGSLADAHQVFETMSKRNAVTWTAIVAAHAHQKHGLAFQIFQQMLWQGVELEKATLLSIINACARPRPAILERADVMHVPSHGDNGIRTAFMRVLLDLMNSLGFFNDDVSAWNNILAAYAQQQNSKAVLQILVKMKEDGVSVAKSMFLHMLSACSTPAALAEGKLIHSYIDSSNFEVDSVLGSALVNMYCKCGAFSEAQSVFDTMAGRDAIVYAAMIDGYACRDGYGKTALELFDQMNREGVKPTKDIFLNLISVCASSRNISAGKLMHALIIDSDFKYDIKLANALIAMYLKCQREENACCVFDGMLKRDVVSWTSIIGAYSYQGQSRTAFELYKQMRQEGIEPNKITFINLLSACNSPSFLAEGKLLHIQILQSGYDPEIVIRNALITMYSRCGDLQSASEIFERMSKRDVVTWNAMISAYSLHGQVVLGFAVFEQMLKLGVEYDEVTLVSILNSCTNAEDLEKGKSIHECIVDTRYEADTSVGTALIIMYSKCGSLLEASNVFNRLPERSLVSWNAILAAYARVGNENLVFEIFEKMQQEGFQPDRITFLSMLNVCTSAASIGNGKGVLSCIVEHGYDSDVVVGTALLTIHARCGNPWEARKVFDNISHQDVISWTAMITTYSQNDLVSEALELFEQMQLKGLRWNKVIFINILDALANLAALAEGKRIHSLAVDSGLGYDVDVVNSLIHLYGKCGVWDETKVMFERMPERTVVSWNTIITSSALQGFGEETLQFFGKMQQEGLKANQITLISICNACSHAGLVEESIHYINAPSLLSHVSSYAGWEKLDLCLK